MQCGDRKLDGRPNAQRFRKPLTDVTEADARGHSELARHEPARWRTDMLVGCGRARRGALVAEPRDLLVVHVELRASGQRLVECGEERGGH